MFWIEKQKPRWDQRGLGNFGGAATTEQSLESRMNAGFSKNNEPSCPQSCPCQLFVMTLWRAYVNGIVAEWYGQILLNVIDR